MKFAFFIAAACLTATASLADSTAVLKAITGKNLTNDKVSESVLRKDGTLYGVFEGKRYEGTWEIKGGQYCRVVKSFNLDGCQDVVAVKDTTGKLVGVEFRNPGKKKGNRYFLN